MSEGRKNRQPGLGALALVLALVAAGGVGLLIAADRGGGWLVAALAGWLSAGLLGVLGWWSMRRALSSTDNRAFMRYTVGGMGARLLVCGLLAGIVIGTQWLDPKGFVAGLLVGIAVFISIEVGSLALAKRLVPNRGG